jgi:two-component system, chemotaxis family, chemotaxis protein CheY
MQLDTSLPVLVIDDSAAMAGIVCKLLRDTGFVAVEAVRSGEDALARLTTGKFELVVSDIEMAPMNGLDILQRIREDAIFGNTCFVFMTSFPQPDYVIAAKKLGADAMLLKPFTAKVLEAKLSQLAKLRAAVDAVAAIWWRRAFVCVDVSRCEDTLSCCLRACWRRQRDRLRRRQPAATSMRFAQAHAPA